LNKEKKGKVGKIMDMHVFYKALFIITERIYSDKEGKGKEKKEWKLKEFKEIVKILKDDLVLSFT
jgi:hypothetical protein